MDLTSDTYVVDASVVVKWFLTDEVLGRQALTVWRTHLESETVLAAPSHVIVEVSNAILSASRYSPPRVGFETARDMIADLTEISISTVPVLELVIPAFELSHEFETSLYDSLYLALSRVTSATLITADRRFYEKILHDHDVLWLGDIEPL